MKHGKVNLASVESFPNAQNGDDRILSVSYSDRGAKVQYIGDLRPAVFIA